MKKNKTTIIAAFALVLYVWLIWPEPASTEIPSISTQRVDNPILKDVTPRSPERGAESKVVKRINHKEGVEAVIARKVSNSGVDPKAKNDQAVIEAEGYGSFPPVDLSEKNKHKEHLLNALRDPENNSGSISIVGKREKFDLDRYQKDPSYYMDSVEPGRAFDSAQAVPGVNPLERVGLGSIETSQNKSVSLEVKGEPGMPVSFTVFDGGHFQNGLSFITLKADGKGIATAKFTPTSGVINLTRIRAASPVSSGTLQWNVLVHLNNQVKNQ